MGLALCVGGPMFLRSALAFPSSTLRLLDPLARVPPSTRKLPDAALGQSRISWKRANVAGHVEFPSHVRKLTTKRHEHNTIESPSTIDELNDMHKIALDKSALRELHSRIVVHNDEQDLSRNCGDVLPRILTRLGLQGRKQFSSKQKPPFVQALENASTLLNHSNCAQATQLGHHCREVRKCITQWGRFKSPSTLADIIVAIHKLQREVDVVELLNGVTHQALPKDAKTSIVNKIGKLSRYHEIARYLSRRCIKDVAFRHLTAVRVVLPEHIVACEPPTPDMFEAEVKFTDVLRQAGLPNGDEKKTIKNLFSLLKTTPEQASQNFHTRVSKTSRKAKVHAEVQLLCFYEMNRNVIPLLPRVVCSSKDACWMCNALIDAHGEMFTPRCHGVLYPGWKQPCLPGSSRWAEVATALTSKLQRTVAESVQSILSSGQRPGYCPPVPLPTNYTRLQRLWLQAGGLAVLLEPPHDGRLQNDSAGERQNSDMGKEPRLSYTITYTGNDNTAFVEDVTKPLSGPALMILDQRLAQGTNLDMEEDESGIIRLGLSSGETVQIQRHSGP
ncbi:uncharacterized protein B0I36DRAFT_400502 [Microdochium trichocladiopsis]|uniref:Uncharacterized protein n=1 Tax=Microdochium trichocladiopsis TaxID=1682393 RepID=A0A9P8XQ14_9PEZI|nr:uncharacterized protein B0I36DRAFT_400502 [Microdochium trichocladiopsis]KAH7010766.1 hypothetical protein B0I36DRAFT_400502 [Microdochium trichocladiopsis]